METWLQLPRTVRMAWRTVNGIAMSCTTKIPDASVGDHRLHTKRPTIGRLLEAMIEQRLYQVQIAEIIVRRIGECTDPPQWRLCKGCGQRPAAPASTSPGSPSEGKTSAIKRILGSRPAIQRSAFWRAATRYHHEDAIENLVRMFLNPAVGMTGAQKNGESNTLRVMSSDCCRTSG